MELQGKVALVTGAGSGIGKAAALLFAREGAAVGVLSRTEAEIRKTADEIERAGGKAIPLVADVADDGQMRQAVADLVQAYGRLDIVFANAGINGVWAPIDELQPAEWDRTIDINLRGTYLTLHHAVPHLKKAGRLDRHHRLDQRHPHLHERRRDGLFRHQGRAGGDGADAGGRTRQAQDPRERGLPRQDRHGDHGQHREAATRRKRKFRPTSTRAGSRSPATSPGTSDEVAELVLFLASDRARHITGTPVWIDGAQSLVV